MEENNKPNYVLKFNDSTLQKIEDKNSKMKKAVVIIIVIIVIGSIIFGENLFLELSWTARILLICLSVGFLFYEKREDVPNPAELQFYDDYLILYCQKKCYSKKNCRKEIFKMNYKDIIKEIEEHSPIKVTVVESYIRVKSIL